MKIKILIVEDHFAMIEGYKSILLGINDFQFELTTAHNCESAYGIITDKEKNNFDIVLLDITLPSFEAKQIYSGEDLAILIKKYMPCSKIIILTSHSEMLILYSVFKRISPNGILVKSDFSVEEFILAFESVINGKTFFSETVKKCIKEIKKRVFYLDTYNRQILSLIDRGIKTKSLPKHLNLSLSAIDKRKVQIKDFFGIDKGNDEDILREARKNGFI